MWTSMRSTAARQLRVSRAVKVNSGLSLSSRVANCRPSFVIPTSYRLLIAYRGFSETSGRSAEETAAKPRAKKTTKTPGKRKPAATKATSKRAAATTRRAKAKKPAAKKAAPKKRAKKVLSPEEKKKAEIRELKKIALLNEPKRLPERSWQVYIAQPMKTISSGEFGTTVKQLAHSFSSLPASEKERLEATAVQNRLVNNEAYKSWVESHSPVQIDAANRARARLRRLLPSARKATIKDDRLPKRPATAFSLFTQTRWKSGEFSGMPIKDSASAIGKEWKSLSHAEKKVFEESAAADAARYAKDVKAVLHRDVASRSPSP